MPIVTADAMILQSFAYGETSRILRLLTSTQGLRSVIAKGARGPRSRFGGLLEPFTRGIATFYYKESRELHTLSGFELIRSHQGLGGDLIRFGGASLLAELVLCVTREDSHPDLFDPIANAFDRLEAEPTARVESVVLGSAWQLVALLGFSPELDSCIECGRDVGGGDDLVFDHAAGGLRCTSCTAGAPGRKLPAHAVHALRSFVAGEPVAIGRSEGHWWLLSRWLEQHVLEGASLRSLAFLSETLGGSTCGV
ncbi:MAG: DNA repair protein RecO [Gemmatimonadetes bacterium]|nr:DNA repair protein RecO [Gemmatimonadota bacterium]